MTNVYPVAPAKPVAAIVAEGHRGGEHSPARTAAWKPRMPIAKRSSNWAAREKHAPPSMKSTFPKAGDYLIRAACNSGHVLQEFDLTIDGVKATRESVPYLDMTLGITRRPYSNQNLSWRPGWQVNLAEGPHKLVLKARIADKPRR